jgi:hypothetical protein
MSREITGHYLMMQTLLLVHFGMKEANCSTFADDHLLVRKGLQLANERYISY